MKNEHNGSIPQDISKRVGEGYSDLDPRTELGDKLRKLLIEKQLKQRELATLLAIKQPEVSHLLNGHFTRFTIDKLIQFFNRLGWVVQFRIYPNDLNDRQKPASL